MKEPTGSCPYLDQAIKEIEEARSINSSLREWGHYWKDKFEEMESELDKIVEQKNDEIKSLDDEIDDLKNELKELNK